MNPGYHLTEVKRVAYETMDCGAMTHRWAETQFELWVPPLAPRVPGRRPMTAAKFLRIIDRVEGELPLDPAANARIHARFPGQPAALYDIAAVTVRDGSLWVELSPDRTRCKAAERRLNSLGACCGSREQASAATAAHADQGDAPAPTEPAPAACCA